MTKTEYSIRVPQIPANEGKNQGSVSRVLYNCLIVIVLIVFPGVSHAGPFDELKTGNALLPNPHVDRPGLHKTVVDPVFGTTIMRITDPSQYPRQDRIRHFYSKSQPFNADGTRAVLAGSTGVTLLYDTKTWEPLGPVHVVTSDPEIQWHPTDPNRFYYMSFAGNSRNVRGMYEYDIQSGKRTLLRDFKRYDSASGQGEGNMDRNGRYYALVGRRNGEPVDAFVYDVLKDRVSRRIPVTQRMVSDWISVSPSGKYVVTMGRDRSRVYDIHMNHLRDLPYGSFGHGDICQLADGSEALVYDGADYQLNHNRNINITDLATGKTTIGVRIGWKSTPHVSCRNLDLPGWALISTQGPDNRYPNHDFEIFWLKLDGSGEVRRVAHHHSDRDRGGYFSEQQAVTNRDGSEIIFASNWDDRTVCDYLIKLRPTKK